MKSARTLNPYEETQLARHGGDRQILLASNAPVEHITGKAEFCGLVFSVTENVLIPRIETEELVEKVVAACRTFSGPGAVRIVDVGTGSGAIAISVASKLATLGLAHTITATDISRSALEIAEANAATLLPDPTTITFLHSDLLSDVPTDQDIIVANLPYIPTARIATLDKSVFEHEPHLALDGGPDGLYLIRLLLDQATQLLQPGALVLLEVDDTHTLEVWSEFEHDWQIEVFLDSFEKNRFVQLLKR